MGIFDDWIAEGYVSMDDDTSMDVIYDIMEVLEKYDFKCGIDATQGSHKEITAFRGNSMDEEECKDLKKDLKPFREYMQEIHIMSKAIVNQYESSIYDLESFDESEE